MKKIMSLCTNKMNNSAQPIPCDLLRRNFRIFRGDRSWGRAAPGGRVTLVLTGAFMHLAS